ncbi:unnamed protein product [Miscanthus lutarioriparius]|uniref:Uncharacterized protein n=1 Tax=Miscanthus lutarioriparius TaxID=422564 RepID=A0A811NIE1_9POAL|nr:unnamed protein product [Miscanthus lutarioriparius]
MVTPAKMLHHLHEHFGIAGEHVSVRRTRLDDFIVRFSHREDLEHVLRTPPPEGAPFDLRWRCWSRLIMGSTGAFRFRVLVGMKGIPAHARSAEVAQTILGSSGAKAEITNPDALNDPDDEHELFVAACCAHPDLIPNEKIMVVPELEHDGEPPLFLRPHEIIHDDLLALSRPDDGPPAQSFAELIHEVDVCLFGPDEESAHSTPRSPPVTLGQPTDSSPLAQEFNGVDDIAAGVVPPVTADPPTIEDFITAFKKPLAQPVILSPPWPRLTRAARSRAQEPDVEELARKVMMKRLGVEIETQLPDEASFDEFQTAFASPLSSSTREAMQVLFPGQEAACL